MSEGNELWDAFVARVERRPDAGALVHRGAEGDEEISYARLHDLAHQARARLDRLGLGAGEPVAVLATKAPGTVALVLACLLSGRPFLLPSQTLPADALDEMAARAGCRYLVTPTTTSTTSTPSTTPAVTATETATASLGGDSSAPLAHPGPGVGFMLTTSGSTGPPKVVPLGNRAVARFTRWAGEHFGIRPGKTVLNHAPLNFDLCLLDVWTTLTHGGRVVLVDPEVGANGRRLLDLLADHDVNLIQAVPTVYRLLLDAADPGRRFDAVEHVIFTGDALPARSLAELPRLFAKARLHNIYGCTETNDSFVHEVDLDVLPGVEVDSPTDPTGPTHPSGPLPLGRPLPGVTAVLMDGDGRVVEGAGRGELHVSTPFQADGYLDPARDPGRFGPDPRGESELRFFRTGDLVRRHADGSLVLEGRNDNQVKVRGVAVNTAEIERVLLDHEAVVEAGVVAEPDSVAGHRLCAVVRRSPDVRLNSLVLRGHCARRLPPAAIPSNLRIVDDPLPRTATGKVDRRRLTSVPDQAHDQTKES